MSNYLDNNELFLQPKTTQYGSHMVMTNVMKPTKQKYINIDTRFRDEYNTNQIVNYNITLPERLTEVKSISVTNIEIPNSIYNVSSSIGNNSFKITNISDNDHTQITLEDGNYTTESIISSIYYQINTKFSGDLSLNLIKNKCVFSSTTDNYKIEFAIDTNGNFDKYQFRSKLGWLLGFREVSYNMIHGTDRKLTSEALIDINGPRYLYLAVDEFTKGNQFSFISPLPKSLINKNILARISVDNNIFGLIYNANRMNGTLVSDVRSYTGKTDLQKLNIQLLNEYGIPVNLNGLDFSFALEIQHE